MQRREFLVLSSMSVVGWSATWRADVRAAVPQGLFSSQAQAVIYDPRYPAARDLMEQQLAGGARAFATDECIVRLWRGPLTQIVDDGANRIAGVTAYSDFALLRECARERGFRVLHEEWRKDLPVTLVFWVLGA